MNGVLHLRKIDDEVGRTLQKNLLETGMGDKQEAKQMGQVIQIDEVRVRDHLSDRVRGEVE